MEKNNKLPTDITAVGQNKEYETLEVKIGKGAVYEYYDFPQDTR